MCVLSTTTVFLAKTVDNDEIGQLVPAITQGSIETLLTIFSANMLVIATFAVASMVSAYASASSTATPRSFSLVISDDVSQNALSTFVGAFIFSVVALIALKNGYDDKAGRFALFVLGNDRQFDEDPRFGLIVLSEIASRALSPAVNDPGTAIGIIGRLVRLFVLWSEPIEEGDRQISECDRVEVPE